jgi:hypothetical protein
MHGTHHGLRKGQAIRRLVPLLVLMLRNRASTACPHSSNYVVKNAGYYFWSRVLTVGCPAVVSPLPPESGLAGVPVLHLTQFQICRFVAAVTVQRIWRSTPMSLCVYVGRQQLYVAFVRRELVRITAPSGSPNSTVLRYRATETFQPKFS